MVAMKTVARGGSGGSTDRSSNATTTTHTSSGPGPGAGPGVNGRVLLCSPRVAVW